MTAPLPAAQWITDGEVRTLEATRAFHETAHDEPTDDTRLYPAARVQSPEEAERMKRNFERMNRKPFLARLLALVSSR